MNPVAEARPEVVRMLMERLVRTFEAFATEQVALDPTGEGLRYVDALMGCHNFYKRIILDIEYKDHGNMPGIWRQIAIDTWVQAMRTQKPYAKEGGG